MATKKPNPFMKDDMPAKKKGKGKPMPFGGKGKAPPFGMKSGGAVKGKRGC